MELIHVMGMSCVGKRTLIDKLVSGDPELRRICGVTGTCIGYFMDGPDSARHSASHWRKGCRLLVDSDCDHALNKWQNNQADFIAHLFARRPNVPQRGIVLWRTVEDNIVRVGQSDFHKGVWKEYAEQMGGAIADIRIKVLKAKSLGVRLQHFDVTGCHDGELTLDRPLDGIPPWIECLTLL
jgi:hypothetical protein